METWSPAAISPAQLLRLEEADWGDISDRIHEDILQSLGYCLLKAELSKGLLSRGFTEQAEQAMDELWDQLGQAVHELRALMTQIRPYRTHPLGLRGALESYLRSCSSVGGVALEYAVDVVDEPGAVIAGLLYRLVRQTLAEVIERRRFRRVRVEVTTTDQHAELRILAREPTPVPSRVVPRTGSPDLGWRARLVGGESSLHEGEDSLEWTFQIPTGSEA